MEAVKFEIINKIPFLDFEIGTIIEVYSDRIILQKYNHNNIDKKSIKTITNKNIIQFIQQYLCNEDYIKPYEYNFKIKVGDYVRYLPNEKKKNYNLGIIKHQVKYKNKILYYIQPFSSNSLVQIEEKNIEKIEHYYFFISSSGNVQFDYIKDNTNMNVVEYRKRMNNYFKTKEEANIARKNLLPFQYKK